MPPMAASATLDASASVLGGLLEPRLDARGARWLAERSALLAGPGGPARLAESLSLASRFAPRGPLAPTADERARAAAACPGWNPERWSLLEAVRVALVLATAAGHAGELPAALEDAFRYADEGELCALYRSLQFLPQGERFAWRAAEGCRTNMQTVFRADVCDTGYPVRHFDDIAWRQMCVKAIFVGAPLWRVYGLDGRRDAELTRMVLDAAEERRSAGRPISPELWLCVTPSEPGRARRALAAEIAAGAGPGRTAAVLALGRIGAVAELEELAGSADPDLSAVARRALAGDHSQSAWQALREDEPR